jgi:prepilin-type processing-associated H-X9-DG protein
MCIQFQLFSDIHLEMQESFPHFPRVYPIVVLSGDIGHIDSSNFCRFIEYCSNTWDHVIFVPGNREFYSQTHTFEELHKAYESLCDSYANVYFLDGHVLEIDNTVFFGATMWTPIQPQWDDGRARVKSFHQPFQAWEGFCALGSFLEKYRAHPNKVIVTHFPIVREHTCHERYDSQPESKKRYFSSNWLHLFPPELLSGVHKVCSGHTHHSFRMNVRSVDVWSNQMGYPDALDPLFVSDGDLFRI